MQNKLIALEILLEGSENKYQLDVAVNHFLEMVETDAIPPAFPQKIQRLFRDKIYDLVFSQGDIVNKLYLGLYIVFRDCDIDRRFEKIENIAQDSMFCEGAGDNENLLLLELATLAKILGGKAQAGLAFYIQNIVLLDIHTLEAQKSAEFILQAFKYFKIPFEFVKENLSLVLKEFATLSYKQKRSFFNWQLHVFWNVEHYFNHRQWLDFYESWKEIFYQELQKLDTQSMDFALYLQFFIYHICGNNFALQEEWKKFNTEITLYASTFYAAFAKQFTLPKAKITQSRIIGILRDRLVANSPYKVEISFFRTLMQDEDFCKKYKIKLYVMSLLEKSDNDKSIIQSYEDLGIEVFDIGIEQNKAGYYNSHLSKALLLREQIQNDAVECLISPNNGYGISDFLFATRTTLKQVFWSHGNFVYDMPNLDLRLTHICGNNQKISHQGYMFDGIPVKMDAEFYNPTIDLSILQSTRALYPKDVCILGNIGRLVKIDNKTYLSCIIEILKANPKSIFLACGVGNKQEIEAKIKEIDEEMLSRFFFPGYVDSGIYGHIIDIWLDSFPMEQGESRIEFSAKDKPSLVLAKEEREKRILKLTSWYATNQEIITQIASTYNIADDKVLEFVIADDFVAFGIEDYIKKANRIITMPIDSLKALLLLQRIVRETNAFIQEANGKKLFLEILEHL